MSAKNNIVQVPIYLYVNVSDEEMRKPDVDFLIEKKVIDKYKTHNNEFHIPVDMLMFEDWDIYETEYEEN
jgi:hypothetical protein